ncbi:MAG: type I glyceraldehyde-3-phosphate dehydrogenase [Chloroflexi bacterium]|nr:type I glyceraldehyde-3-phosphate dehydrogenase [Chloroflexota bacterium]
MTNPTRIAFNGFGRTGRQAFKAIYEFHPDLEVVGIAVRDVTQHEVIASLLAHDSNYGAFNGSVKSDGRHLIVNGKPIALRAAPTLSRLPWRELGVDIVIECTGKFTKGSEAAGHLEAGAKKVIITAPAKNEDVTVVLGVNEDDYEPQRHHIVSNSSCTTNCLATTAKVLHDNFGIEAGLMTTVHSYTSTQQLLDKTDKDARRSRSAPTNIVPSTTGAAKELGRVLPQLAGKFNGLAMRVPTPTVSIMDFVALVSHRVSAQEINDAFQHAATNGMKGILAVSEKPLVSMDFKADSHSSIVDALLTQSLGKMIKVSAWYDNEWGYSCRVADLAEFIARKGL